MSAQGSIEKTKPITVKRLTWSELQEQRAKKGRVKTKRIRKEEVRD